VAAHVLRGALLGGLPLAGPFRLRGMGRGDGLCRPPCGEPEEVTPAIEKANDVDDRPVVIDFRTDSMETSLSDGACRGLNDDIVVNRPSGPVPGRCNEPGSQAQRPPPSPALGSRREQGRCARPRRRTVLATRLQHLLLAVAPTDDERFSRISIVVDVESSPLEQSRGTARQAHQRREIGELHPDEAREAELLLVSVSADAGQRSQVIQLVVSSAAVSSMSGTTPSPSWSRARPSPRRLREPDEAYGIAGLQRTGRIALPKLDGGSSAAEVAVTATDIA